MSNLPRPYLDDLNYDNERPGYSVGSARGSSLRAKHLYVAYYRTSGAQTDGGRVIVNMASTRRPRNLYPEWGYCTKNGRRDSACYFNDATQRVGVIPINSTAKWLCHWGSGPASNAIPFACKYVTFKQR